MSHFSCIQVARAVLGREKRREAREALWLCPGHLDSDPSLSVNESKDVWSCFPCDRHGKAWELLAFLTNTDASDKKAMVEKSIEHGLKEQGIKLEKKARLGSLICTYSYHNEDGTRIEHQKKRYSPGPGSTKDKEFIQGYTNEAGEWISGLDGRRLVIYNLPQVIKSPYVVICEGEKDCDNLAAIGIVATTSPGGAGHWAPEFNAFVAGKNLIIPPDNDTAGELHAVKVSAAVLPVAKSVRILKLPNLGSKGDVSDWIAAGGTKEEFIRLVKLTPVLAAPPQPPGPITDLIQVGRIEDIPDQKIEWLVQDLIPRASLVFFSGEKASFKSWLGLDLGARVSEGIPFAGHQTIQVPTLYMDRENPAVVVRQHSELLGIGSPENLTYWGIWHPEEPCNLNDERLYKFCLEHKPLVIFDSLIRFSNGKEENSAEDMAKVTAQFRNLVNAGATVVVIAHKSDKAGSSAYRGSSEILAGCDVAWLVVRQPESVIETKCLKNRFAPEGYFRFQLQNGGFMEVVGEVGSARPLAQAVRQ